MVSLISKIVNRLFRKERTIQYFVVKFVDNENQFWANVQPWLDAGFYIVPETTLIIDVKKGDKMPNLYMSNGIEIAKKDGINGSVMVELKG